MKNDIKCVVNVGFEIINKKRGPNVGPPLR